MHRLDRENLKPSPAAGPSEWLRRVSFDLTGLTPSPEDLAAYQEALKSDPAAARAGVVDRLLASPRFGERWTAVWLDLARYSDTYGFEKDRNRDIWPFRDWVIRSESNLPRENIHKVSGPAAVFSALRLRILPDHTDPKKWAERGLLVTRFQVNLIDLAGAVTPVATKKVFADRLGDVRDPAPGGNVGGFPKLDGPRCFVFVPKKSVIPKAGARLEIAMTQKGETAGSQATPVRNFAIEVFTRAEWLTLAHNPERRAAWKFHDETDQRHRAIGGTMVPVMIERPARETRVFARGNRLSKENMVSTGVPELLANNTSKDGMSRLDMARWIASPENPLTARVMVNRLWVELFGTGIVLTSEDFGTSGTPPSHPELLDHLALRFENHFKWSVKSMLREIVLSSTYRQSHRASKGLEEKDPANRLLARGPRNRLSAEMVRDLCSARRLVSNTPLQALVTLNDPAHIEAAQSFAKRMRTLGKSPGSARVRRLARHPASG